MFLLHEKCAFDVFFCDREKTHFISSSAKPCFFQESRFSGRGGYFWYFGQVAVHQRRAKPMVHAARAAKNTKQIGRRPSRCDIGAVRVPWLPHFSPGASRNSIRAAIPQISLLSQTVFSRNHGFRGGGELHFFGLPGSAEKRGVRVTPGPVSWT